LLVHLSRRDREREKEKVREEGDGGERGRSKGKKRKERRGKEKYFKFVRNLAESACILIRAWKTGRNQRGQSHRNNSKATICLGRCHHTRC
jgi:hypothetical protein